MIRKVFFLLFLLASSATCVHAADGDTVGRVKTVSGPVHVMRGSDNLAAKPGMKLVSSDTLITGKNGSAGVVFSDNSTLSLGSDTRFQISRYEFNVLEKKAGFVGRISRGTMVYLSGLIARMNADATRFETPVAVAGVRGTKLAIRVDGDDNE
jgi:hypothetical protein